MKSAIVVVTLLAVCGSANAERLAMKRVDGTNLHIANQGGAINWQEDTAVTIDLDAKHKLVAVAIGKRVKHDLDGSASSRSTDVSTIWTTRWSGTWALANGSLILDVAVVADTCTSERTMTEYDAAKGGWVKYLPEKLVCKVASKQSQLTCTSAKIIVDEKSKATVDAWRCVAKNDDLGETPQVLLFGKSTCLQTTIGHMSGDSFARCVP